jgi:lipid-A-disaccharide synthase-like uncharacterized protein
MKRTTPQLLFSEQFKQFIKASSSGRRILFQFWKMKSLHGYGLALLYSQQHDDFEFSDNQTIDKQFHKS